VDRRTAPVAVLSSGRSGSTLLQKLLNTHPDLVIWGEHGGVLHQLMHSWRRVSRLEWIPEDEASGLWLLSDERPLNETRWTAWDGPFSRRDYLDALRGLLDSLFARGVPAGTRWGFKEIRYRNVQFLDFFTALYPDSQFVLLVRNPLDVCVSFASASDRQGTATPDEIRRICEQFRENQIAPFQGLVEEGLKRFGDRVLLLSYEGLLEAPLDVLDRVSRFLQLSEGFSAGAVAAVSEHDIVSERKRAGSDRMAFLRAVAAPILGRELGRYREQLALAGGTGR
jgi:hypothetical protein